MQTSLVPWAAVEKRHDFVRLSESILMVMMRIQKYLSQKRILSRREAEEYIRNGLIKLNGTIIKEMGAQIDPDKDLIEILPLPKTSTDKITIAVYKPRGVVSSKIRSEGKTIFELLPKFEHLNAVGRLDKESEGLILLSNDGAVTAAVTGDQHTVEKEYEVTVQEVVSSSKLRKMAEGVRLNDGLTLPAKTWLLSPRMFSIVLKEGRKHQIRRMAAALQLTVTNIKRIRIGNMSLQGLKPGQYRLLSKDEINRLKSAEL